MNQTFATSGCSRSCFSMFCQLFKGVALLLCLTLLAACSDLGATDNKGGKNTAKPVPVSMAQVRLDDVPIELKTIGSVEPFASVAIKSQVDGVLEKVGFKEGDQVNSGAILFKIDPRPFAAKVAQARADLVKDQAALDNARKQAARYSAAAANGYVSAEQADEAQTSVATLAAVLEADEAALANAQLDLDNCVIRAPISGFTGALLVDRGNLVRAAADRPLVTINQVSPIKVSFTLPEQNLAQLRSHLPSTQVQVSLSDVAAKEQTRTGRISFIDNMVNQTTGTIRLKANFENTDAALWPGQFVPVRVQLAIRKDAVVVPTEAVQTGLDGDYVYVVGADQRVKLRPVKVAFNTSTLTVIDQGLTTGETVVTDGQLRLQEGATVKPVASGGDSTGAAQ
ncbi:efflux RND transporter periplasmic adaptor subunit [Pelobacter seleniigenes]|uniref:efflux RND transporter periplasmic adaptor subunit n=1 Tax=Pelobacter seleniigenes TaxID=407188 RepID=UPI0004A77B1F|nr:efflux RND transporter periplasmic adaptor subunit [Pelobacter seleniigenes]